MISYIQTNMKIAIPPKLWKKFCAWSFVFDMEKKVFLKTLLLCIYMYISLIRFYSGCLPVSFSSHYFLDIPLHILSVKANRIFNLLVRSYKFSCIHIAECSSRKKLQNIKEPTNCNTKLHPTRPWISGASWIHGSNISGSRFVQLKNKTIIWVWCMTKMETFLCKLWAGNIWKSLLDSWFP